MLALLQETVMKASWNLGKALASGCLNLPESKTLPEAPHLGPLPKVHVIMGDEAFEPKSHAYRSYPEMQCSEDKQVFTIAYQGQRESSKPDEMANISYKNCFRVRATIK